MRTQLKSRKLRIESLEERTLPAVTSGAEESIVRFPAPTGSNTWNVNTLDDQASWDEADSILSLREAIGRAEAGDTINFVSSLKDGSIVLNGTQLEVTKSVTIDAASIGGITIDANGLSRVIYNSGGNKTAPTELVSLTITGGKTTGDGGGIYNNRGTLTLTNSTVSGNRSSDDGGAFYNYGYSAVLTLTSCTVSGNSSGDNGGGIYNSYGSTSFLYNTIIAQNTASRSGNDVCIGSGSVSAYNSLSSYTDWASGSSNNLTYKSSQPLFKDTAGGDYTLAENSQAIDKGNNTYVTTETDLAGNPRIVGGIVDLGAYEYRSGGGQTEQLAAPVISTGSRGVYVSYGANRHCIQWGEVAHASGYELAYSASGTDWTGVSVSGTSAVVTGLTYGQDVQYRVRALGTGSYTDSDWSRTKTFSVCPMDINGDGDIAGSDRTIMATSWLAEVGDENYQYYADINGDGEVSNTDRPFIGQNWNKEAGDDDLVYPRALRAADAVFAGYEPGGLDVDWDVF